MTRKKTAAKETPAPMKPVERATAAFAVKPTDRVPLHHIQFSSRAASLILGRPAHVGGGIQQYRESVALWQGAGAHAEYVERCRQDALDLALATDQDLIRPGYWRMREKPTRRLDEFTFLYGDPAGTYRVHKFDPATELYQIVDQRPLPVTEVDDLERQIADEERAATEYVASPDVYAAAVKCREAVKGERAIRTDGGGVGIPYGMPVWLEAMLLRPDLIARKLDADVVLAKKLADVAARLGFPFLFGGGDMATNQGTMYSPRVFHELMLPRVIEISRHCHSLGMQFLFGSDGNLWPVADDLFGTAGADGYFEVDFGAGMDPRRLRERFPHLTIVGILPSALLHRGTKDQVVEATLRMLETAREVNGVFVGCSNQIVPQTPPENIFAMLETLRKWR